MAAACQRPEPSAVSDLGVRMGCPKSKTAKSKTAIRCKWRSVVTARTLSRKVGVTKVPSTTAAKISHSSASRCPAHIPRRPRENKAREHGFSFHHDTAKTWALRTLSRPNNSAQPDFKRGGYALGMRNPVDVACVACTLYCTAHKARPSAERWVAKQRAPLNRC